MKKLTLMVALACSLLTLSGCKDDPVKTAKGLVFPTLSNAVTIGTVLDTYKTCQPGTQKWEAFETKRKEKIVSFSCVDKNYPSNMKNALIEGLIQSKLSSVSILYDLDVSHVTTIPDLKKWVDDNAFRFLTQMFAGVVDPVALIEEVEKESKAFDIANSKLIVQLKQSINNKNEYELGFVGHTVQYTTGKTVDIGWNSNVLQSTAYADVDFSAYLTDLGYLLINGVFVNAYKNAK